MVAPIRNDGAGGWWSGRLLIWGVAGRWGVAGARGAVAAVRITGIGEGDARAGTVKEFVVGPQLSQFLPLLRSRRARMD